MIVYDFKDRDQLGQKVPLCQENRDHPLVTLLLWNSLKLGQKLRQVVGVWIWHFVLEIEQYSLCGRYSDSILTLILLNQLPEGIGTVFLLEWNGHDLIFLDLSPLNAVYCDKTKHTVTFLKMNISINGNFVLDSSFR